MADMECATLHLATWAVSARAHPMLITGLWPDISGSSRREDALGGLQLLTYVGLSYLNVKFVRVPRRVLCGPGLGSRSRSSLAPGAANNGIEAAGTREAWRFRF